MKYLRSIVAIMITLITVFSAACVPTPDKEVVIGKDKIDSDTVPQATNAPDGQLQPQDLGQPEHLTDSFTAKVGEEQREYTISIDAEISVPESGIYPVYAVEKEELVDEELAENMIATLYEGCTAYDINRNFYYIIPATRSILQRRLEVYEQAIVHEDSIAMSEELHGRETIEFHIESMRRQIENLEGEIAAAADEIPYYEYEPGTHTGDIWGVIADSGGVQYKGLNIIQGGTYEYAEYMEYDSGRDLLSRLNLIGIAEYRIAGINDYVSNCESSLEEAREYAEAFIEAAGLSGQMGLAACGSDRLTAGYAFLGASLAKEYGFVYTPIVNGVPMAYVDLETISLLTARSQMSYEANKIFSQLWRPNNLKIWVDDDGITMIRWESIVPDKEVSTITENAQLLPFEDIYEIFKSKVGVQGNYRYSVADYAEPISCAIKIDKIELSYYRVKSGQGEAAYALIPVWNFYGHSEVQYTSQSDSGLVVNEDMVAIPEGAGYTYLMINAIDGSVIDPLLGY